MCRIGIFPSSTKREFIEKELLRMCLGNDDGVGTLHVRNGHFKIVKTPKKYPEALTLNIPIFDDLPVDGWFISHLRAASCGGVSIENTHPFQFGDYAFVHNGSLQGHSIIRAAAEKFVKFYGETDSEAGAYLLSAIGHKRFYDIIPTSTGVFAGLNRKGELWIVKRGWSLYMYDLNNGKTCFTTEPPIGTSSVMMEDGWIGLSPEGDIIEWEEKTHYNRFESGEQSAQRYGFLGKSGYSSYSEARLGPCRDTGWKNTPQTEENDCSIYKDSHFNWDAYAKERGILVNPEDWRDFVD